jgi:hypothetical protein
MDIFAMWSTMIVTRNITDDDLDLLRSHLTYDRVIPSTCGEWIALDDNPLISDDKSLATLFEESDRKALNQSKTATAAPTEGDTITTKASTSKATDIHSFDYQNGMHIKDGVLTSILNASFTKRTKRIYFIRIPPAAVRLWSSKHAISNPHGESFDATWFFQSIGVQCLSSVVSRQVYHDFGVIDSSHMVYLIISLFLFCSHIPISI